MVSPLEKWARLHVASDLTCHWKSPVSAGFQQKYSGKTALVSSGVGHVIFGKNTICVNQDLATKCVKNY